MSKIELRNKLLEIVTKMGDDSGSGHTGNIPTFDYYALDYLEFAEQNLEGYLNIDDERKKENELISCVSNLKRALENQIECFLESWNLRKVFSKKNIGLYKKLDFLSKSGFFSSRTINRFGLIRNKVEHDFQKPKIDDLESLFDLVTALVSILQNAMTSAICDEIAFVVYDNEWENEIEYFKISYDAKNRNIKVKWWPKGSEDGGTKLMASISDPEEFSYFFKILVLLNQLEGYASFEHIKIRIKS